MQNQAHEEFFPANGPGLQMRRIRDLFHFQLPDKFGALGPPLIKPA